ncbi:hypothetical protein BT96DRAFT_1019177 [Gymnopus androsaceus JB14]|uniref:Uncharacterized protein n=1 Tax=Gymnopus androsaceus JB14 TaxID=1447944 RepID=A0A6A4HM66_9AGAR|nr:hypothetical protein BT96DRAFT_1019177 [Gymnopus androsaceus JB14]
MSQRKPSLRVDEDGLIGSGDSDPVNWSGSGLSDVYPTDDPEDPLWINDRANGDDNMDETLDWARDRSFGVYAEDGYLYFDEVPWVNDDGDIIMAVVLGWARAYMPEALGDVWTSFKVIGKGIYCAVTGWGALGSLTAVRQIGWNGWDRTGMVSGLPIPGGSD